MIVTDLLATLDRIGATVRVTTEGALKVAGPKDALTEELVAELRAHKDEIVFSLAWDEGRAVELLRQMFERVAAVYRPNWAGRLIAESPVWTEAEARIEAAALVRDMRVFTEACRAYEDFALETFARWHVLERDMSLFDGQHVEARRVLGEEGPS